MIVLKLLVISLICIICIITDIARKDIDFIPILLGLIFIIPYNLLGYNNITLFDSFLSCIIAYSIFRIIPYMGMGDARLLGLLGLFFGYSSLISIIYIFNILIVITLIPLILFKKVKRNDFIAIGPFICLGVIIFIINTYIIL